MYLHIVIGGYLRILGAQCSIILHLIDICFLPYLVADMDNETCLRVVVAAALVSHFQPVRMAGLPKNSKSGTPIAGGGRCRYHLYSSFPDHCDSSTNSKLSFGAFVSFIEKLELDPSPPKVAGVGQYGGLWSRSTFRAQCAVQSIFCLEFMRSICRPN